MAVFNSFASILPDPANPITDSGYTDSSGTPGPGFKAVNFTSVTDTQVSRTISGRGVQRDGGSHHWEFTIQYNPMFRYQFDPIDTFLLGRNPRRDPFYVILPQYSKPKDSWMASYLGGTGTITAALTAAGSNTILATLPLSPLGKLRPGDMFTVSDPNDFLHQKIYKVTAVETFTDYQGGTTAPTASQFRLHFAPPLVRSITSTSTKLNFINPKFRVIAKSDTQEHSLDTENLYSFSLACEEIQP